MIKAVLNCIKWVIKTVPNYGKAMIFRVRYLIRRILYKVKYYLPTYLPTKGQEAQLTDAVKKELSDFSFTPVVSIIMPVYNVNPKWIDLAIKSIKNQWYSNWELWLIDDASNNAKTKYFLQNIDDRQIQIKYLDENVNISRATNVGLDLISGEYVLFMDNDDLLTPDALYEVIRALNEDKTLDVIYSDQDKVNEHEKLLEPFYKPDWSIEYLRGAMYIGHLLVVRATLAKAVRFDSAFDNVQDFEFMLRLSEKTERIHHIPKILYHWRMIAGSVAFGSDEKSNISQLQVKAVNNHLVRVGVNALAVSHPDYAHRVVLEPLPRQAYPLVSIVILTKDAPQYIGPCLKSIYELTTYTNFEVVVVDNNTTNKDALEILKRYPIKRVAYNSKFNYSQANNIGVKQAKGEYVFLLNNDTEVKTGDWLERMIMYLEQEDVGAVGPLLVYPDDSVQHAGVVLGPRGTADHVMRNFPADSDGYYGSLSCAHEVSGVTGACLGMSKNLYEKVGGLNEFYGTHYQDVDLCLKILKESLRIIFVPQAKLIHYESVSRENFYDHIDRAILLDSWGDEIAKGDKYYNPNLSLDHIDYRSK